MLYLLPRLMRLVQDLHLEKPESVWPTSVAGWVGLFAGCISVSIIAYDRATGRASNWRDIKNDIKDLTVKVSGMLPWGAMLRDLEYEIKGIPGDGGGSIRQSIQEVKQDINAIKVRNQKMDVKAAVFERLIKHPGYEGPERRNTLRELQSLFNEEIDQG